MISLSPEYTDLGLSFLWYRRIDCQCLSIGPLRSGSILRIRLIDSYVSSAFRTLQQVPEEPFQGYAVTSCKPYLIDASHHPLKHCSESLHPMHHEPDVNTNVASVPSTASKVIPSHEYILRDIAWHGDWKTQNPIAITPGERSVFNEPYTIRNWFSH